VKIRDRAAAKMASGLSDVMLHGCLMLEATVHRVSDERTWWKLAGIDPIKVARKLWRNSRLNESSLRPSLRTEPAGMNAVMKSDGAVG